MERRSDKLLNKVYDHLDKIDVSGLSMRELQDFLEVAQKGRFLETLGQTPTTPWFNSYRPPVSAGDENGKSGDGGND